MTPGLTPLDALPVLLGTHWIAGQVLHVLRGRTAARTRQPRCSLLTVKEREGTHRWVRKQFWSAVQVQGGVVLGHEMQSSRGKRWAMV